MSPRALFFDLDETLLDDNTSYHASVTRACEELLPSFPDVDLVTLFESHRVVSQAYWQDMADHVLSGAVGGETVRLEAWRRTLLHLGHDDASLAQQALDAYSRHRSQSYLLFDDAAGLLKQVHGRCPLALITNGSGQTQWEKVRCLGLDKLFDVVLVSGEIGAPKPAAAMFHLALDKLALQPADAWHIGDNLHSDVAGAHNAGLTSVWLNRHGVVRGAQDPVPHYEVASLGDIAGLLGSAL